MEDSLEDRRKKIEIKIFLFYKLIPTLIIIGVIVYFSFDLINTRKRNVFCSKYGDGITIYKGKYVFCKEGNSAVLNDYRKYTKAICNEENYCIDVIIECNEDELIDITPVSEGIQLGGGWEDNRSPEQRWGWCNEKRD